MFRPELIPDEWNRLRDRSTWERLARLRRGGASLEGEAAERLEQIESAYAGWRLTGEEREDFPTWMESGWGLPTDYSVETLLELNDDDLIRVLREHEGNREGLLVSWRQAAERNRSRAIRILNRLREEGYLDIDVCLHGLAALRELSGDASLPEEALHLLEQLPRQLLAESKIVRVVADVIRALSENLSAEVQPRLLTIWDIVFPKSFNVAVNESDECISSAINHPTGILVEAIFIILRSRPLERNVGIDEDVRTRLERVVASDERSARLVPHHI